MRKVKTHYSFRIPRQFSSLNDLHVQGFVLESECEKLILEQLWVSVAHDQGLSLSDLGQLTGITRQTLSGFASGKYRPDILSALLICEALEIPMELGFRLTGSSAIYSLCRDRSVTLLVNLRTLEVVRNTEVTDSDKFERLYFKILRKKVNADST